MVEEEGLMLCRLIDEPYTNGPLYGSRRMIVALRQAGYEVNRQRVQRCAVRYTDSNASFPINQT